MSSDRLEFKRRIMGRKEGSGRGKLTSLRRQMESGLGCNERRVEYVRFCMCGRRQEGETLREGRKGVEEAT